MKVSTLTLFTYSLLYKNVKSFVLKPETTRLRQNSIELGLFFAEEAPEKTTSDNKIEERLPAPVDLVSSDDERFINMAGSFLVDNFWLKSDHHNIDGEISSEARMNLIVEQCADLQEKYGERMGKRLLESCVLGALEPDTKEMVGVATLKSTLLVNEDVLEAERAEVMAKNAVAALGPKQRREYKDASIDTIASELLSPDSKAIVLLSNLATNSQKRNRGIGKTLCNEAEVLAQNWGYSEIYLLVESENLAARKLYQDKLGYELAFTKEAESALRADIESGSFTEVTADTLVLVKKL